jgi:hypothetical protein
MSPSETQAEHGPPTTRTDMSRWHRSGVPGLLAAIAAALLIAGLIAAGTWASAQYRASGYARASLASRLVAAEAAARVNPLNRDYRTRVITLRGLELFGAGDILGAYDLLHAEYVREAIANNRDHRLTYDPQLAAAHELVWQSYWAWSSRAAHVMHGKEQPDGTIKPEDVQKFPRPAPK